MNWQMIVTPLIGALIGYVTNKIAVEMLFKPLKPLYIGRFHIPFTPGIIPKEKSRLAKAIGSTVGTELLTASSIKKTMLSEKILNLLTEKIEIYISHLKVDITSVDSKLLEHVDGDTLDSLGASIKSTVVKKINDGIMGMNVGEIVAKEVLSAIEEKVKGTMIALMLNSNLVTQMVGEIEIRVNNYVKENGEEKIYSFVNDEFTKMIKSPVSSYLSIIDSSEITKIIINVYISSVENYTDQLINALNLSQIVEEKIEAMDIIEVEKLVLSIMEKELGAVVNLGAIIGFILGLLNLVL